METHDPHTSQLNEHLLDRHKGVQTNPESIPGFTKEILQRATEVPATESFPSVDDLWAHFAAIEAQHPDLVSHRRIGTSRLGEPIHSYMIGSGSRNHLIVGGVHPNEPIGSLTAIHLAQTLCSDSKLRENLDATWHIVPCIDPDGMRLNEGWFRNSEDRVTYSRHFYRPAPQHQVEWSFPLDYNTLYFDAVLPETLGLMRLIDDVKPELYFSLHNGEMGGVFYYLSKPTPELYQILHAIPAHLGLPLNTGEPEAPYFKEYAPAVFGIGTVADAYDYLEKIGVNPAALGGGGASSSEYASRHGTLTLIAEMPYWSHSDSNDQTPLAETYSDLARRTGTALRVTGDHLTDILGRSDPHLRLPTPFLTACRAYVPSLAELAASFEARLTLPESQRPATVAERFGCEDLILSLQLRYGGMLLRALEAESAAGTASPELRRLTAELAELYAGWQGNAAASASSEVIPISSLVGVQFASILAGAGYFVAS